MNTTKQIILGSMTLLLLGACSGGDNKADATQQEEKKPMVRVQKVEERDVDQISTYTASVEADLVNNISAQQANRIKAIYVDEGMRVSKGQKLVQLDDVNTTTYQLQVDNAKANLANAQLNYDRALELYNIGGGTKQNLDQMTLQLTNAKNAVASAERALRNVHENTTLVSPINGVVTARNYDPGDMTGQLPILTISTVQPVKIAINVSEGDLSHIKKGMPAVVTFDTYGDEKFDGTITLISPTVDAATRTFGVEVTLPNRDNRLLPGMFGRVSLNLGTKRHVVVPDRAVIKQQGSGNHYVYVLKDGKAEFHMVELGQRLGDSYELVSGVENGADVIIEGQAKLTNGAAVEVAK